MRFDTLQEWLAWQEQLHPQDIELGLERVAQVWQSLGGQAFSCPVISVAGTNGKGSSIAMLQSIYMAAGYRVGSYTSPHLWQYQERIKINAVAIDEAELCQAFAKIDEARGEISLTYFEFGTLAALLLFQQAPLDIVLLEVGLGGRLDAVNIIDADVAIITSIDLDHQAWLGNTREAIAKEKAGILRADQASVIADPRCPELIEATAKALGNQCYVAERDYQFEVGQGQWRWQTEHRVRAGLPLPALAGAHQQQNAAGVLMALEILQTQLPVSQAQIREGLLSAELAGRFQVVPGEPTLIFDVAHNPAAAQQLAHSLAAYATDRRCVAVFGLLADKDIQGVVRPFCDLIAHWCVTELHTARAKPVEELEAGLLQACPSALVSKANSVKQALLQAQSLAKPDDIILVFGSFYTVTEAARTGR